MRKTHLVLLATLSSTVTLQTAWGYVVNSPDDAADITVGDCQCTTILGKCTLRAAIQEMRGCTIGAITFDPAITTVKLTLAGRGESLGATGDLNMNAGMTIDGGTSTVTVDGNYLDRVFSAGDLAPNLHIYLKGLRIIHGRAQGTDRGGGLELRQPGTQVKMTNVVFDDNQSQYGGGGIALAKDTVATLEGSTASGQDTSTSCEGGGAIYNAGGHVDLLGSDVWASRSVCGDGGGVLDKQGCDANNNCSNASLRTDKLNGVEVRLGDNVSGGSGGALMNAAGSTADLAFAHFIANTNGGVYTFGGGIFNEQATLTVTDSSFSSNQGGGLGSAIADDDGSFTATRIAVSRCSQAVFIGGGSHPVWIASSTFEDGSTAAGAAILVYRPTIITASTFTGHSASTGGAIYAAGAPVNWPVTLQIAGSRFEDSTTVSGGAGGGAIFLDKKATAWVYDTIFHDSHADFGAKGGAIFVRDSSLLMQRSVIYDGSAGKGGAIAVEADASVVALINVTLSNNSADTGGALHVVNAATLSMNNVTATLNHAVAGNGGALRAAGTGPISLSNTILGNNTASGSGPNCSGTVTSSDYNLVGVTGGCTFVAQAHDLTGTGPLLQPLALVGGTYLHIPQTASMAWNHASSATSANLDQRGVARPLGLGYDIGAYEGP